MLVLPFRRKERGLEIAAFHRKGMKVWQLISGGGEDGETPEAAAAREVFEEAGIQGPCQRPDSAATVPAAWFAEWPTWPEHILVVR